MLMRTCLNSKLTDIDDVASTFMAKKQRSFDKYVKQKEEYYDNKKKETSIFFL